jgi:hypothetical protein
MRQLSVATLALLTLTACGRKGARSADFDSATAAALATGTAAAQTRNMPKVAHVVQLELGHALDRKNQVFGGASSQFRAGDSVLVAVRTQYLAAGANISAIITQKNATVDSASTKSEAPDSLGYGYAGLRLLTGAKWTKGTYQAAIWIDGKFQLAQEFTLTP